MPTGSSTSSREPSSRTRWAWSPPASPSGQGLLTVHRWRAGVGSALPAASTAVTTRRCAPGFALRLNVGPQGTAAARSSLHVNVEPASEALKEKEAARFLVLRAGPLSILVSGAVVSLGAGITGSSGGGGASGQPSL